MLIASHTLKELVGESMVDEYRADRSDRRMVREVILGLLVRNRSQEILGVKREFFVIVRAMRLLTERSRLNIEMNGEV